MTVIDVPARISWCDVWWALSAPTVAAILLALAAWWFDREGE